MCSIDRQLEGTLPAYVFSLLVIYYLQQCSPPVLPVLHEVRSLFAMCVTLSFVLQSYLLLSVLSTVSTSVSLLSAFTAQLSPSSRQAVSVVHVWATVDSCFMMLDFFHSITAVATAASVKWHFLY